MSATGITSLALFAPVVASNAVFSARRAQRGVDAMEDNPLFSIANFDIAAAQILKGGRAAKALAYSIDPTLNLAEIGSKEIIKSTSAAGKVLGGIGRVISFTADHINPIIIGAGAIKVAGADDKIDEAGRESTRLLCMFGGETAMKSFIGMPYTEKVKDSVKNCRREGLYKKLFTEKQLSALNDFFLTKKAISECTNAQKVLKAIPGITKGLLFVGASITGYKLGDKIATAILGEKKTKSN